MSDRDPHRAKDACRPVGWDDARIAATNFVADGAKAISGDIEVVVEATGNPAVGIRHARAAIAAGKHIVMVNVEADVLAGPLLAEEARKAGVVYSLAYGDQPALTAEMVGWARADRLAAGPRRQSHKVFARLSRGDAGRRLESLRTHGRRGQGRRHEP